MKIMSDATKHNLMWNTLAGKFARKSTVWLAVFLMRKSRKMLKWSLGRCSWCGAHCGFDSTVSAKGVRCDSVRRNCTEHPDV